MSRGTKNRIPEGWKKTKLGVVYRFQQKRDACNSFLAIPRLTLNEGLFTIWYPSVCEGPIDEHKTTLEVGKELKQLLNPKRYITIAQNDHFQRGRQLYHIEYYTKLEDYPSKEQIDRIVSICDNPIYK